MPVTTKALAELSDLFGEYDELIDEVEARENGANWLADEAPLGINECLDPSDSRYVIPSFSVGDLVTQRFYTDAHAGRIVEVRRGGKEVVMQRDIAKLDPSFAPDFAEGGFVGNCRNNECQRYTYTADPDGVKTTFTLRTWRGVKVWTPKSNVPGCPNSPNGSNQIGHGQHEFHDYNF